MNICRSLSSFFNKIFILGSKIVRSIRTKETANRKTSLDTLIEVVQKELLRVNEQTDSISTSSNNSQLCPISSSHSASLTSSQTHHNTWKLTHKPGVTSLNNSGKSVSLQQRSKSNNSYNNENNNNFINHHDTEQTIEDIKLTSGNIEEIVRETVNKLVAMAVSNNASFIVNMHTTIPDNDIGTNTGSQMSRSTLGGNVSRQNKILSS